MGLDNDFGNGMRDPSGKSAGLTALDVALLS
jgi:hypothetical protein